MKGAGWKGRAGLLVESRSAACGEAAFRMVRPDDAVDLLTTRQRTRRTGCTPPIPPCTRFQPRISGHAAVAGLHRRSSHQQARTAGTGDRGQDPAPLPRDWRLFTMAAQVSESDTFVMRAAEDLNVEMLNGDDGYGTFQVEQYKQLDEALDIDGVVLTFFVDSDVHDNGGPASVRSPSGAPRTTLQRVQGEFTDFYKRSALYAAVQMQLRAGTGQAERARTAPLTSELMLFTQNGGGVLGRRCRRPRKPCVSLQRRRRGAATR